MIGLELLKRLAVPVIAIAMVICAGLSLYWYGHAAGQAKANAEWQSRWDKHALEDSQATAAAQAEQRAIEASRQQAITKVTQDAQQEIDHARADAAASDAAAVSLRDAADDLARRVSTSQASVSACTTAASQAAARAARVLADVLKRVDQRAGVLAAAADQSRARGLACERAYDGVDSQ